MIKVFLSIFLGVVLCAVGLYVFLVAPKANAASTGIVMTRIQAGGNGAATQEFIVLYNNSDDEVDISGWCLTNKNSTTIACFTVAPGEARYLPSHAHAAVVSNSYASLNAAVVPTVSYAPISQSSGSITGSADTISLLDHTGTLVDRQSWTTSLAAGMQFERRSTGAPGVYQDTDAAADWNMTQSGVLPNDETVVDTTSVDICPNIDAIQLLLPVGKEINAVGECVDQVVVQIEVTEILPNAVGTDAGNEFIELYNPNDFAVQLSDYVLYVGPQLNEKYALPIGVTIGAHEYKSFTNNDINFNLLNTSSKVLLALKNGIVVSEVLPYQSPKEGQSWAFIDGMWQYTDYPTPGRENVFLVDDILAEIVSTQKPCAVNQYRSLETGRCRLLSTLGAVVTPCKDGQYRSEETNRCRNIASETKTVTPCVEGQERNMETNRCRKIAVAATATPCKAGQERNPDTNRCRTVTKMSSAGYAVTNANANNSGSGYVFAAVGGVLLLALGYAVWEWHYEIGKFFRTAYGRVGKFAHLRK